MTFENIMAKEEMAHYEELAILQLQMYVLIFFKFYQIIILSYSNTQMFHIFAKTFPTSFAADLLSVEKG